jgi:hypothetical protein
MLCQSDEEGIASCGEEAAIPDRADTFKVKGDIEVEGT